MGKTSGKKRSTAAVCHLLEKRQHFASTVTLVNGILTVQNDNNAHTIRVDRPSGYYMVFEDGAMIYNCGSVIPTSVKVYGNGGNDTLTANFQTSIVPVTLAGGDGNDTIYGGNYNDLLQGNAGNDAINGGAGVDSVDGGTGDDRIDGATDNGFLYGGDGNDVIQGGDNNDLIWGQNGDDAITGYWSGDTLSGGAGEDAINYNYSNAPAVNLSLDGVNNDYDGAFQEFVTADFEIIHGSPANDTLVGSANNYEMIFGNGGNDIITGLSNSSVGDDLYGGDGNDTLIGSNGEDFIRGGNGNDVIFGNDGNDILAGDDGQDSLYGGAGSDELHGGGDQYNNYLDGGDDTDWAELGNNPFNIFVSVEEYF